MVAKTTTIANYNGNDQGSINAVVAIRDRID